MFGMRFLYLGCLVAILTAVTTVTLDGDSSNEPKRSIEAEVLKDTGEPDSFDLAQQFLQLDNDFNFPTSVTNTQSKRIEPVTIGVIFAGVSAIAGTVSAVIAASSFIYGVVKDNTGGGGGGPTPTPNPHLAEVLRNLNSIRSQISTLNEKLDGMQRDLNDIKLGQKWILAAAQYSRYTQQVDFLRKELAFMKIDSTNGNVGTKEQVSSFMNQVLRQTDSANKCLYQIHHMIMGTNSFFQSHSLVNIFRQSAPTDRLQSQHWFVQEFIDQLIGLQVSGYLAWFTALNMAGRESEIDARKQVMYERFKAQAALYQREIESSHNLFEGSGRPWNSLGRQTQLYDTAVPNDYAAPIRGCHFVEENIGGSDPHLRTVIKIECTTHDLVTNPPTGPAQIATTGYKTAINPSSRRKQIVRGLGHRPVCLKWFTDWVMVPNPLTEMVCGLQMGELSNGWGIKIRVCSKDMKARDYWVSPSGSSTELCSLQGYHGSFEALGRDVTPDLNGWVIGVRLPLANSRFFLQLKTSYL